MTSGEINMRMADNRVGWTEIVFGDDDEDIEVTGHLFDAGRIEDGIGQPILFGRIFYDQHGRFSDGDGMNFVVVAEIEKDVFRARSGNVYRVRSWA